MLLGWLCSPAAHPPQEAASSPTVPQTSPAQSPCPEPESALSPPTGGSSKPQQSKCQAGCEVCVQKQRSYSLFWLSVPHDGRRFEDFGRWTGCMNGYMQVWRFASCSFWLSSCMLVSLPVYSLLSLKWCSESVHAVCAFLVWITFDFYASFSLYELYLSNYLSSSK